MATLTETVSAEAGPWLSSRTSYELLRERQRGGEVLDPDTVSEFLASVLTRMRLTACHDLDGGRRFLILDPAGTTVRRSLSRDKLTSELLVPMLRQLPAPDDRPSVARAVLNTPDFLTRSSYYRGQLLSALWEDLLRWQARRGEPSHRFDVAGIRERRTPDAARWKLDREAEAHATIFLDSIPDGVLRSEAWSEYQLRAAQSGIPTAQHWPKGRLFRDLRQRLEERRRADGVRVFRPQRSGARPARPLSAEARAILRRAQAQRGGGS